jgi:hypothetical protein
MKKTAMLITMMILAAFITFTGCEPDDQNPDPDPTPTYPKVFKCLINGQAYEATSASSSGSYINGTPYAKGIRHSNGSSTIDGDIRWLLNFGSDNQGNLVTGAHSIVQQLSTLSGFNNQGQATIKEFKYLNMDGYVVPDEGSVTVTQYYYRTSDNTYLGAKGTFDNIKVVVWDAATQTMDTVLLTQGVFDFKQYLP